MTRAYGDLCWRAVVTAAVTGWAGVAFAQTPVSTVKSPATARNLEVSAGGTLLTPVGMGSRDIQLVTTGSPLTIGATESRTAFGFGADLRLGFRVTDRLSAEAVGGWSRVKFETSVTGDTEQAASVTPSIYASRFVVGGAAAFRLGNRGKRETYLVGGVSWLREAANLSAGGLFEDGTLSEAGVAVKLWLRERTTGRIKRLGLRLEGRVGLRTGGISLDTKSVHLVPIVAGSLIIGS